MTSQDSLDNIVTRQPRAPPFSTDGLVDYLVELVVCEDKAFQLVDKGPFRRILTYLRPSLSDKDIPHRQTRRNAIVNKAKLSQVRVKEVLKVIALTCCKHDIYLCPRTSLGRCCSPSMPGPHRSATHTCPSRRTLSMVSAPAGSCILSSWHSLHYQAVILVLI